MDFQSPQTPPSPSAWRRAATGAAVLALGLYALLLMRNVGAVAGGSDTSGYMNHARLLASGHLHVAPRTVEGLPQSGAPRFLYVPLGFKPAADGRSLVPTYPAGFALFVLLFEPLAGWRHSGDLTIILHSLAGIALTFALGRALGLGRRWSALGAAIVATSPLYLCMSLQAMSDVPSLAWTTAAVLAALKARERPAWALAAGAAVAVDVLLRPTNILALIPVAVALGGPTRRWVYLLIGGLPGAVFFAAHSIAAYGTVATTGYGDNAVAFLAGYVPGTLLHYALWLPVLFTPLVVLNLGLPWVGGVEGRTRWLLSTWILGYAVFYSAYEFTQETWWFLRFLLPAGPAMAVGSLLVFRALVRRKAARPEPRRGRAAFVGALILLVASSILWARELHALSSGRSELRYGIALEWMKKHVPPNAVCLAMQASGALAYYTPFTFIRWDELDRANVGKIDAAIRDSGRPLYAVLFPFEVEEGALEKRMPGRWNEVENVEGVGIWRREFDSRHP